MNTKIGSDQWDKAFNRSIILLATALLILNFYALVVGLSNGIDDFYGFRQAQTALTAQWLLKEPHAFAYQTPVLGYPWSVPFEYPVYQWVVVFLAKLGAPLVPAGRIVSFSFSIGCLVPAWGLLKEFGAPKKSFLLLAVFYLGSPFCIFWSRTFMIESTATFFSLCWLWMFFIFRRSNSFLPFFVSLVAGCIAVLAKSTTFIAIGPIAGFFVIYDAYFSIRLGDKNPWRQLFNLGLCLVPLALGYGWVIWSDQIKSANPFGVLLDSRSLFFWNFGTPKQRLDVWPAVIRDLHEDFGFSTPVVPLMIAGSLFTKHRLAILAATVAFLSPFLIFSNLLIIHTYYQAAVSIFASGAIGLATASLLQERNFRPICVAAVLLISISQVIFFTNTFWPQITSPNLMYDRSQIALAARSHTTPDQAILVFGEDWSSVVPFVSERRALAMPFWAPASLIDSALSNPAKTFGNIELGAIVQCKSNGTYSNQKRVDEFLLNKPTIEENQSCKLLSAKTESKSPAN